MKNKEEIKQIQCEDLLNSLSNPFTEEELSDVLGGMVAAGCSTCQTCTNGCSSCITASWFPVI